MKHSYLCTYENGSKGCEVSIDAFYDGESKLSKVAGLDFLNTNNAGVTLLCKIAVCNLYVTRNSNNNHKHEIVPLS